MSVESGKGKSLVTGLPERVLIDDWGADQAMAQKQIGHAEDIRRRRGQAGHLLPQGRIGTEKDPFVFQLNTTGRPELLTPASTKEKEIGDGAVVRHNESLANLSREDFISGEKWARQVVLSVPSFSYTPIGGYTRVEGIQETLPDALGTALHGAIYESEPADRISMYGAFTELMPVSVNMNLRARGTLIENRKERNLNSFQWNISKPWNIQPRWEERLRSTGVEVAGSGKLRRIGRPEGAPPFVDSGPNINSLSSSVRLELVRESARSLLNVLLQEGELLYGAFNVQYRGGLEDLFKARQTHLTPNDSAGLGTYLDRAARRMTKLLPNSVLSMGNVIEEKPREDELHSLFQDGIPTLCVQHVILQAHTDPKRLVHPAVLTGVRYGLQVLNDLGAEIRDPRTEILQDFVRLDYLRGVAGVRGSDRASFLTVSATQKVRN